MGSEREAVHGREDPRRSRALAALRELVLARNDEIAEALGPAMRVNSRLDGELYRRRLADGQGVAATLAKLFRLTLPVPLDEAVRGVAPPHAGTPARLGRGPGGGGART